MDDAKTYVSANYMLLAAVLLVVIAGIYFLLSRPRRAVTPHDPSSGKVQNRPLSTTADIMSRSGPPEQPHQIGDVWYYADHAGQVGPFTLQDLTVKLASMPNAKDLFVWCEGMTQWQKVAAVPAFNERIKPPPPPYIKSPRDLAILVGDSKGRVVNSKLDSFARFILLFIGTLVVTAVVANLFADKDPTIKATVDSVPASRVEVTSAATKDETKKDETNLDLASNKTFLASNPKYLDAIHELITHSGYECPEVQTLWLKGTSPLGTKLEALCGPRGSTNVYPALHYSVYPERLKVDVCKPFSMIFGGGCE